MSRRLLWGVALLATLLLGSVAAIAAFFIINQSGSNLLAAPVRWQRPFPPTVIHPNWTSFTNANQVNDVAVRDNVLFAATDGGLVAWELGGGEVVKYLTEHGLAANRVRALAVAPDGVLWLATANGLSRFDGASWQSFRTEDGLADNDVLDVAVSQEGNVWAGTANGLSRFNGRSWRTFRAGQLLTNLPSSRVQTVAIGGNGRLWVGTDEGVAVFNGRFWQNHSDGLSSRSVLRLVVADDGTVWAGTAAGLNRFDGQAWQSFASGFGLPADPITALAAGSGGSVWLGAGADLLRFDGVTVQTVAGDGGLINGLRREDGTLWAATTAGVAAFDGTHWRRWQPPNELPSAQINGLVGDETAVWLATESRAARFDGVAWRTFGRADGLPDERVRALAQSRSGTMWAAFPFAGLGVARFDGNQWQPLECTLAAPPSRNISGGAKLADGSLWFGTDLGVARLADGAWTFYTTANGLPSNSVLGVTVDGETVWAATAAGVARLVKGVWETIAPEPAVQVEVAANGTVWLLRQSGELARLEDGQPVVEPLPLPATIRQLLPVGEAVWLATSSGIMRFDGHWRVYTTADGLGSDDVGALAVDENGRLWASSSGDNQEHYFHWFDGERWQEHPHRDPTAERLHANRVTALVADGEGGMWLGMARGGIQHTDGTNWQSVEMAEVLPLDADVVDMVAALGQLWLLTRSGLVYFDGATWQPFGLSQNANPNGPTRLAAGPDGDLWLAPGNVAEGLRRFDGLGWTIVPTWTEAATATGLDFGENGRLWLAGTLADGRRGFVGTYDGRNWAWHIFLDAGVLSLAAVDDGAWVGLDKGLGVRQVAVGENGVLAETAVFAEATQPDTLLWANGTLFVGSGDTIYAYDGANWGSQEVAIPFVRQILALAVDGNGRLWAGTEQGLAVFDGQTWETAYAPPRSPAWWGAVQAMTVRPDGGIVFGTAGGGVGLFTGRGFTGDVNPDWGGEQFSLTAVLYDDEQGLWVGTQGAGVARLDERGWRTFVSDPALAAAVQSLAVAADGTAWLGTAEGLVSLTGLAADGCRFDEIQPGISGVAALTDSEGTVWFGTLAHGALRQGVGAQPGDVRWDNVAVPLLTLAPDGALWFASPQLEWLTRRGSGGATRIPLRQDVVTAQAVTALAVAPDLTVWLGTARGVVSLVGGEWRRWETAVGLADNEITHLLVQPDGSVWLATRGGVSRYRP